MALANLELGPILHISYVGLLSHSILVHFFCPASCIIRGTKPGSAGEMQYGNNTAAPPQSWIGVGCKYFMHLNGSGILLVARRRAVNVDSRKRTKSNRHDILFRWSPIQWSSRGWVFQSFSLENGPERKEGD